jgi:hypothetical protein
MFAFEQEPVVYVEKDEYLPVGIPWVEDRFSVGFFFRGILLLYLLATL